MGGFWGWSLCNGTFLVMSVRCSIVADTLVLILVMVMVMVTVMVTHPPLTSPTAVHRASLFATLSLTNSPQLTKKKKYASSGTIW